MNRRYDLVSACACVYVYVRVSVCSCWFLRDFVRAGWSSAERPSPSRALERGWASNGRPIVTTSDSSWWSVPTDVRGRGFSDLHTWASLL